MLDDDHEFNVSIFSLTHVLLPVAMHHILSEEFHKKDNQALSGRL